MGAQLDKQIMRLCSKPKDYTYSEVRRLLCALGFVESTKGHTSGSRVQFYRERDKRVIDLHKPHPGDEMRYVATLDLLKKLREYGDIE